MQLFIYYITRSIIGLFRFVKITLKIYSSRTPRHSAYIFFKNKFEINKDVSSLSTLELFGNFFLFSTNKEYNAFLLNNYSCQFKMFFTQLYKHPLISYFKLNYDKTLPTLDNTTENFVNATKKLFKHIILVKHSPLFFLQLKRLKFINALATVIILTNEHPSF